jgi:hypothetical protein
MPRFSTGPMRTALLLLALLPIFFFTYAALVGTAPEQVFNSDLVQPFMVVRDFLRDPMSMASWHLSPAIYVFPDCLIALILHLLAIGPVYAMIANGAVLGVLLTLAGGYVLHVAGLADLPRALAVTAAAMLAGFVVGLVMPGTLDTDMQIWTLTTFIHSGTLLSGVALVGLWSSSEIAASRRPHLYVASLVLAGLASYSDVTFLIYVVIPVAIASGIAWLARPERALFRRTLLLIAVAVSGFALDRLTRSEIRLKGNLGFVRNIEKWLDNIGPHLADNPLLVVFLLAMPVMLLRALYLTVRALKRHKLTTVEFIEIALAGIQGMAVLVPMLTGVFHEIWNLRYSLPIAFLPLLWILVLCRKGLARPWPFRPLRVWAAGIWGVAFAVSAWAGLAALPTLTAEPPVVTCMQKLGLDTAYAWYWDAKAPVFLSNYRIHMVQLDPNGTRSIWNTNDRWVTHSVIDDTPISARAIDMRGLHAESVELIYGPAAEIESCGEITFWVYDHDLPLPPDEVVPVRYSLESLFVEPEG